VDVFRDGHLWRGTHKGVLEDPGNITCTLKILLIGDVMAIDADPALVGQKRAGKGIEQR
jgi:hypothetical protein